MGYPAGYPGTCPDCGTRRDVSLTYASVLCPLCDEWQSPLCRGSDHVCHDRPPRPSGAADLDLAPHEIHPDYDLNTEDTDELLRRVVLPVVRGTLDAAVVQSVEVLRASNHHLYDWPTDLRRPSALYAQLSLTTGEVLSIYLSTEGHVDPHGLAADFAERLEDDWCESSTGWGHVLRGRYDIPGPTASGRA